MRSVRPLLITIAALLAVPVAQAVPLAFTHQARLLDSTGNPLTGAQNVTFTIYAQSSGGSPVWTETASVTFDNGMMSHVLGSVTPLRAQDFDANSLFLGLAVAGSPELTPRVPLVSVPFAVRARNAQNATNVTGGIVDASEIRVNGVMVVDGTGTVQGDVSFFGLTDVPESLLDGDDDTLKGLGCSNGQIAAYSGSQWGCVAANGHQHNAADITSGTMDIGRLPVGTTNGTVAAGDHLHSFSNITGELGLDRTTGSLDASRISGNLPLSQTTGTLATSRISGNLPLSQTSGTLDATRIDGDLPLSQTSGTLDVARLSGNIPLSQTTGTMDIGRTTGNIPASRLPADSDTLKALSCTTGQVAAYNATTSAWACTTPSAGGGGGALFGNWEFDENNGTTFVDTSGNGNSLTAPTGGQSAGSLGHAGNAVNFSGGVLQAGSNNRILSTPYVTAEAWIRPATSLADDQTVLTKIGAYTLTQADGYMKFAVVAQTGTCEVTHTLRQVVGTWAHVSGSYNGREVSVTVNDQIVSAACTKGPLATTSGGEFLVGALTVARAKPYIGFIDELRLWSTADNSSYSRHYRAAGGEVTEIANRRIHTFRESGTFTAYTPLTVDVLVVAGGGGGGQHNTTNGNGGGGGGGVIYRESFAVPAGTYAVNVGAGGGANKGSNLPLVGRNGGNSTFHTLTAIGGGGGGSQGAGQGQSGGSGGGGASNSYPTPGNGTTGQGNAGGQGNYTWTGGGGGGAGGPGVNGNACGNCAPSGNGGPGVANAISGTTRYYGGGGGGGGNSSERAGDGFDGGGRGYGTTSHYDYRTYVTEVNATTRGSGTTDAIPNTGGGGGAGSYWSPNVYIYGAGSGGSGIVIIRYPY